MMAAETALARTRLLLGQEIGVSRWITVDQAMIDQFAETTQDTQYIHTDPARAAKSPFGGTVAHGFLTLSFASRFAYDCMEPEPGQIMSVNYGFDWLRFLHPVRAGSQIRGRFILKDATLRKPDELMLEVGLTIEIGGIETPALVADWLTLVMFAPAEKQ